MVARAHDVLSRSRVRADLEIPDDDTSQDDYLDSLILAAVSFAEAHLDRPLVARKERYRVPCARAREVVLAVSDLVSVDALRWRTEAQSGLGAPLGVDDNPKLIVDTLANGIAVQPPEGGWPGAGDVVWLDVTRDVVAVPDAIAQACAVALRAFYDGLEIRDTSAFYTLCRPFRRTGRLDVPEQVLSRPHVDARVLIRVGWSQDDEISASDLSEGFAPGARTGPAMIPLVIGNRYLVLWRAYAAGGDFSEVHIADGGNQRSIFGTAVPLSVDGVDGVAIRSVVRQKAGLLSGEIVRVE